LLRWHNDILMICKAALKFLDYPEGYKVAPLKSFATLKLF